MWPVGAGYRSHMQARAADIFVKSEINPGSVTDTYRTPMASSTHSLLKKNKKNPSPMMRQPPATIYCSRCYQRANPDDLMHLTSCLDAEPNSNFFVRYINEEEE